MKKLNHLTKSILIVLSGVGMLILSACQETENLGPNPEKMEITYADVGKLHNELIGYYYENRSYTGQDVYSKISELNELNWKYLKDMGYDDKDIAGLKTALSDQIDPGYMKKSVNDDFSIDTATFMDQLLEKDIYTLEFIKAVSKVLKTVYNENGIESVSAYVNSEFNNLEFTDPDDIVAQEVFVNIFNSSNTFWTDYYSNKKGALKLKKSSWVIINDGIGGVLGTIFGPVGTVVVATAFSVGTNEEIKN